MGRRENRIVFGFTVTFIGERSHDPGLRSLSSPWVFPDLSLVGIRIRTTLKFWLHLSLVSAVTGTPVPSRKLCHQGLGPNFDLCDTIFMPKDLGWSLRYFSLREESPTLSVLRYEKWFEHSIPYVWIQPLCGPPTSEDYVNSFLLGPSSCLFRRSDLVISHGPREPFSVVKRTEGLVPRRGGRGNNRWIKPRGRDIVRPVDHVTSEIKLGVLSGCIVDNNRNKIYTLWVPSLFKCRLTVYELFINSSRKLDSKSKSIWVEVLSVILVS